MMPARDCGVIFDCDGTLVDSLGQAIESFDYALRKIGERPRTFEEVKKYFGAAADRIFLQLLGDQEKALAAFEHYLDHQSELAKTTRLHTGVSELLNVLKEYRIPMAIVTGRHARDLEIVIRPHNVAESFAALIADSQLPKSKPAPDGILLAARQMGLDPARTIYVGDSTTDLQAARAAGSLPVAVLWDQLVKPEEMKKEKPAFMAKTPMDVWHFFRQTFAITS